VRVTTAFKRLLRLPGVNVTAVEFESDRVVVTVALRRRRLVCPESGCGFSTRARYDTRPVASRWRHLDLGAWPLEVEARLRRLSCPQHGERTEGVPFARPVEQSRFTRDFEHLVAWLATRMDKTAIERCCRIAWRTVGRIIERVVAEEFDPARLDGLFEIGVDEISWRRHHHYLSLVANHRTGKVVWGAPGRDAKTLDGFFAELGSQRSAAITAVSMDMGPAFAKSVRKEGHAPQAAICIDPFHVVALATKALDEVRRDVWQQLRRLDDQSFAKRFKGARWALLKRPENLTERQAETFSVLRRNGGAVWRAYVLKEALREVFAGDLTAAEAEELLRRWCSRAQRSRLAPFVKAGRTIRSHLPGIVATLRLGVNNGRVEGLNNRVRLIVRRAFGFHSAEAALALVMLSCGPIELVLPHER
jgi:transposase